MPSLPSRIGFCSRLSDAVRDFNSLTEVTRMPLKVPYRLLSTMWCFGYFGVKVYLFIYFFFFGRQVKSLLGGV